MKRIEKAVETLRHKKAIFSLWRKHATGVSFFRVLVHDLEKLGLILAVGDDLATAIHRKLAGHHNVSSEADFAEAYLDWASARVTKPSKPLDAVETARRFYPAMLEKAIEHRQKYNFA